MTERLPEDAEYDRGKWEMIKRTKYAAAALKEGQEIGVPQEELERFMAEFIAQQTANGDFGLVYRFMKSFGIGTEAQREEMRVRGEAAVKEKAPPEVHPKLSKASTKQVTLSNDATFADLFEALDAVETAGGETHFEAELHDNFGADIVEELLDLQENPEKARTLKVLDFFDEREYTAKEISILLPIKFRREKKKPPA